MKDFEKTDRRIRHGSKLEEDLVVKWDDDGRMRLYQPSLNKVEPQRGEVDATT